MILWIGGGIVLIVIVVIVAARVHAARSERHSVETYGHGLAALGDVAKRSGSSASVRVLPREEVARAHVRTGVPPGQAGPDSGGPSTAPGGDGRPPAGGGGAGARRPSGPPPRRPVVSIPLPEGDLSFEDRGEEWGGTGKSALRQPGEGATEADSRSSARPPVMPAAADGSRWLVSPGALRRPGPVRKTTVAAAAVLLILTAGVLLAVMGGTRAARSGAKAPHHRPSSASTSTTAVTTTTAPLVRPISTSGDDGTFKVPPGHYILAFTTTNSACWVGIETGLGSGSFFWDETVQAGSSASFRGSGPLAVVLGAPEYLSSVTLNGVPVEIPKGITAYNLVFASR